MGLVPSEMGVGVKFLKDLQAEFELASQGCNQGDCLVGMPIPFDNNICTFFAFENSMVHIEFQGRRLHRRAARLISDKHECIHFAQLRASWNTAVAFCNLTSFLQCGRTPA